MQTAQGADALLGFLINGTSDLYDVGQPGIDPRELADPTVDPTAAAGATGLVTGSPLYKYAYLKVGGFETVASDASAAIGGGVSLKHVTVTFTASGDASCEGTVIYRSEDGGTTWGYLGTNWDPAATTFDDNVPFASALVDYTRTPKTVNDSSANYGLLFVDPDSFDLDVVPGKIIPAGLSSAPGRQPSVAGPITVSGSMKGAFRSGAIVPLLYAGPGAAVRTAISAEPVRQFVWDCSVAKRSPRALTAFSWKGSEDIPPVWLYELMVTEATLTIANGKLVEDDIKFVGCGFGEAAPAEKVSGTGTYEGSFAAFGRRNDVKRATDDVLVKVTQAISGGTFKVTPKVGTAAAYSTELTGYVDSNDKQTKGGAQVNDKIELVDESGSKLGFDSGSNRLPFFLCATEALTGIAVNDIYSIARTTPIPGTGTTPFSGVAPVFVTTPRFTDAHVELKRGTEVLEVTSATVKLMFPRRMRTGLGRAARYPALDVVHTGTMGVEITFQRDLLDTDWQYALMDDEKLVVTVVLDGELIEINPGTYSTYRDGLQIVVNQMAVDSAKSPVTGPVALAENVALSAEQPTDRSKELFTITATTDQDWRIPA